MFLPSKALVSAAAAIVLSAVGTMAFAQRGAISSSYLTGVWKESDRCRGNEAMVFFPNNTMSSAGSAAVSYTVSGPNQILMYGPGGNVPIQTQYVNPNQMVMTFQNGAAVLHRCSSNQNAQNLNNNNRNLPGRNNSNLLLTSAYIAGGWTDSGNCAAAEIFTPGGEFQTSQGDPGTWALFGNTLRLTVKNGSAVDLVVQANNQSNMTLTSGGTVSNYARCF